MGKEKAKRFLIGKLKENPITVFSEEFIIEIMDAYAAKEIAEYMWEYEEDQRTEHLDRLERESSE